ncbi:MAG: APC family permease, partial [Lachnospiraceae bacterium]|nr:APC family permease [Lachnospiraceae bacterium]
LYTMAGENILPKWFGRLNKDGSPKNALLFLMAISLFIPFLGRTAIGWIVDVNTVGATIAYGYTSAAAFVNARKDNNRKIQATGMIGILMSVVFFFYFMAWSSGAMSTESYLILAFWSILGFIYFRYMFGRDKDRRFGKSTVVWIGLLFLIFFTSLMWVKQATDDMTEKVIHNISEYYEAQNQNNDPEVIEDTERYLAEQLKEADRLQTRNSMIQMGLILASLAIMFSIYTNMSKREKQMEIEKFEAEESSRAKKHFSLQYVTRYKDTNECDYRLYQSG